MDLRTRIGFGNEGRLRYNSRDDPGRRGTSGHGGVGPHRLGRYAAVVGAVAVATGLRAALWPFIKSDAPFAVNWLAVIFAAWYAGTGGGIVATLLSAGAVFWLRLTLGGETVDPSRPHLPTVVIFVGLGIGVSLFVGWLQRTAQRAAGKAEQSSGQRAKLVELLRAEREAHARSVREVERRRRAEEALHNSEAQHRLLADSVPQLVWMARADGHVEYFNARWREYTGTPTVQALGWGWEDAVHAGRPAGGHRRLDAVAGHRRAVRDRIPPPAARRRVPLAHRPLAAGAGGRR